MSSGPQACRDDEDEWEKLSKKLYIDKCNWDVYSVESRFAKDGFTQYNLTGILLEKFVSARKTLNQAQIDFESKLKILLQANSI